MSNWALIIYCGLITYLTRFSMIALIKKEMFNNRIRQVLSYVPSAIFPAIIFPAIFLDNSGLILIEDNPKIIAAITFGFPSISNSPVSLIKIAGKIIAGNIAEGTNDNISLILSLNISFLINAIIENLVR